MNVFIFSKFSKATRFGYLRNSNDPIQTFEGDNNVLLQQTSNHLISVYEEFLKTKTVQEMPLQTNNFLYKFNSIINYKFNATSKSELLTQSST